MIEWIFTRRHRALAVSLLLSTACLGLVGCANRGMTASTGDGGDRVDVRRDATGDLGGGDGPDSRLDGGNDGPVTCPAVYNFEEGNTYGAKAGPDGSAFKMIGPGTNTQCGAGSLEIAAMFSGTSGATVKGVVLIELATPQNWAGKTFTISVSSMPPATPGPTLSVNLISMTSGFVDLTPLIRMIPGTFVQQSYVVPAAATNVSAISIQATEYTGYEGKLYIDEIDIK